MGKPINVYQAKTHFSELLERAAAGEEIVIAKAGRPIAMLGPLPNKPPKRVPGRGKGRIWAAPDFDAPDPEIDRLFYGTDDSEPDKAE